jgi:hypothetical protein
MPQSMPQSMMNEKQSPSSVPKQPKVTFKDTQVKVQPPIVKIHTSPPPSAPTKAPEPKKTTESILKQQAEEDLDKELQEELEELNISIQNNQDVEDVEDVEDVDLNQHLKKN